MCRLKGIGRNKIKMENIFQKKVNKGKVKECAFVRNFSHLNIRVQREKEK